MAGHASTIRSTPQLLVSLLGLLAVLAGLLGMHMLANPHPAAAHSPFAAHTTELAADTHPADPLAAPAALPDDNPHHAQGCPDCGPGGCVAGLCVIFLVLVSITAVLGLKISSMLRGPDHRGPPPALPTVQAPPAAPSLVQLCISRT